MIIYSARKWARLALAGNPTGLLALFVPDDEVVRNEAGADHAGRRLSTRDSSPTTAPGRRNRPARRVRGPWNLTPDPP